MAVTAKPTGKGKVDVGALIRKGGSPAAIGDIRATVPLKLRVPVPMLRQVDEIVAARKVPTPRHSWLLEAIHEKIERDMRRAAK